ncbi:hypothetical protein CAPTEDRAFT_193831 [Capitella teleta]|uniref:KN homeodomain domain-containing protein n=1 Tax=Capitella teleta TaxID=283909 RepID=R7UYM5_CAPTE|nr:hypothetical protein CAPTEDRAFT_193831 [Capitella teleta]|eukprot:ELU11429.1 hypothetical protein CAPTEDRAFT_193831 [Capitella teleta]
MDSSSDSSDSSDASDTSDSSGIETVYSNTPPVGAKKKRPNTPVWEEATDEDTRSNKSLPQEAKAMMAEWMYRHADNPYPSAEKVAEFVHRGGIEKCQVKQYLINFRRRQLPKVKQEATPEVVGQIKSKTTAKRSKIRVTSKETKPTATSSARATPAAASLIKTTPTDASLIKADAQAAKREAIELAMAETAKAAALATIGDFTDPSKKNYSFGLSISTMTWMARVQDMLESGSS